MKFIIFDIDGTLTDTKKIDEKCYMNTFEATLGVDIRDRKWENFKNVTDWGITEELFEQIFHRKPQTEEYKKMISDFVSLLKSEKEKDISQFAGVDGAKDFFNELRSCKQFQLGIATGSWEDSAKLKLDAIGIRSNEICFSNCSHHKTREDITRDVIAQLKSKSNEEPEQIVYFGDGKWDYITSRNLGIKFIGIDIEGNGILKELGADLVFRNYKDKGTILKEF